VNRARTLRLLSAWLLAPWPWVASVSGQAAPKPPPTRRDDVVDTLHGEAVPDPYRWLEDEASPEVQAWTAAQTAYARAVLDRLPDREALAKRLWELYEIGGLGTPVARPHGHGKARAWRYFYTRRDGKQNQPVLYVRDGVNGDDRALVDVNALAADGTRALDWWVPSEDGALVAYGISADGSEESVLHVRDARTGPTSSSARGPARWRGCPTGAPSITHAIPRRGASPTARRSTTDRCSCTGWERPRRTIRRCSAPAAI